MKISNQNQRNQVASEKPDEASATGQVPKGAQRKTAGHGIVGDSFEIAKSPGAFDQLMARNGRVPFRGQGVDLPAMDPNDAAGSIRHDDPAVNPSLDGGDPRGDLDRATLERETVVDVAATTPGGHSLEQSLPTGLDGKPLPTGPRHYGNDQAEKFLRGRSDSTSPLNMQRDPLAAGKGTGSSGSPQGGGWRDVTKSNEGNAGGGYGKGNAESKSGGTHPTPPPGAELSFRAPNMGLVSGDKDSADGGSFWDHPIDNTAKAINDMYKGGGTTEPPPDGGTKRPAGDTPVPRPKTKPVVPGSPDDYMTNPDADPGAATGAGTLTEDEVARMVAVGRGDIDVVEGYGAGPQVEGDTPPVRYRDLVTDPGADDPVDVSTVSTATVTPPGQEISKPINPNDGLGPELPPSGGGTGPSNDGDS